MQGYSLAILSITGSSNTSRALLKRVIISGSPPLSGWCWTASNLWACFTCSAFKRPVKGSPRLWRALMASSSGSRPNGHCSRRWLAFPGFRLAFDALDRLLAAVPKPLDPLVLLVKGLLVTYWRDCKITSECLSAIQRWRMRWPRSFARVDQISSIRCLAVNVTELRQVKTFNPAQVDRWIDWPSQSCKINPWESEKLDSDQPLYVIKQDSHWSRHIEVIELIHIHDGSDYSWAPELYWDADSQRKLLKPHADRSAQFESAKEEDREVWTTYNVEVTGECTLPNKSDTSIPNSQDLRCKTCNFRQKR